jgi:hypothetical protein
VQIVGQLIPAGLLDTVPVAVPLSTTLTVNVGGVVKVAVTNWFELSVTAQVEFMPQLLTDHPAKVEF